MLPFDLHVLGLPPAFTLSQDQTLHLKTHSPKTKNLKLQMLDRWQRFACFKTIDMLLDQTSARWTYILPAGAFTRYLRILSKNLGVGLSAFLRVPRRFRRGEPPIIDRLICFVNTFFQGRFTVVNRCCRCRFVVCPRGFRRCEPPIMSGFSFPSTPSFEVVEVLFLRGCRLAVAPASEEGKYVPIGAVCEGGT